MSSKYIITDKKGYIINSSKPLVYKANDLYERGYDFIYTGLTLIVSGKAWNKYFYILLLICIYIYNDFYRFGKNLIKLKYNI